MGSCTGFVIADDMADPRGIEVVRERISMSQLHDGLKASGSFSLNSLARVESMKFAVVR